MPQDSLQIALEHHRGGRLAQAEAGYRSLLRDQPAHADAAHWLGVLLTQAGQFAEAVPLLEQAAAARPEDAAVQHNLGQALVAAGRPADAIAALTESAALQPDRAETLLALGRAYLARRAMTATTSGRPSSGDATAAVAAFRRAHAQGVDAPELHHDLGVALTAAGRPDEAIAALRTATAKRPDYAAALYQLAAAHRAKGDKKEVRNALNKSLEADPKYAKAWHALAVLDAEAGNLEIAVGLFRKATRAKPDYVAAYEGLAGVLQQLGREAESAVMMALASAAASVPPLDRPASVADYEQRVTPAGDAAKLHEALAAAVPGLPLPPRVSPAAVGNLFDRYASQFDQHLRDTLKYQVPELIAAAVKEAVNAGSASASASASAEANAGRSLDVLDLGCGTGLCGPLLRPMARSLVGVDLSPAMVRQARLRGVYDRLDAVDLLDLLRQKKAAYDVLVAADVLIYFGDLAPVVEPAVAALRPGGLLAFSVEAGDGDRFQLRPATRRYAHAEPYLRRLAGIFGLRIVRLDRITARAEAGRPVAGFLVLLQVPGRPVKHLPPILVLRGGLGRGLRGRRTRLVEFTPVSERCPVKARWAGGSQGSASRYNGPSLSS
jgi:predicted TPR repeat methyltransferase